MSEIIPQLKKRGRKPKNKIIENKITNLPINSEEDAIIAHLPISLEDIVNIESSHYDDSNDIFIKSET